jgi:hypothetical protein
MAQPDVIQTGMIEPGIAQPGTSQPSLAQPGMMQPGTSQPGMMQPGVAAQVPTPAPSSTGHAPMVADGYYAAATRDPQQSAGQSWPPQYPGSQQPSWQQPSGLGPQTGAPGTQYAAAQQQPATRWPQSAQQSTPWPQPGVPTPWPTAGGAGAPGTPNPLAQYTPGHRRPSTAEVPRGVLTSIRLMYLGAAVTLLYVLVGASAAHRDDLAGAVKMGSDLTLTAVWGGVAGVVCWIIVATSCRRGHSWTRAAATILLALHTVGMLTVLLEITSDPIVKTTTIIIWIIGLAAVILLWSQDDSFFQAWRKR